jgi:hypothetical protein
VLTATVCVALSGAGLAVALLTAWRRRFRRAVRIAGVSLLPVGLYLAGLVTLGRRVGTAVGDWAADLVFKPTVWIGFAVLAFAVVLYLASKLGSKRAARREAVEPGADTARLPRGASASSTAIAPAGRREARPAESDPDLRDVEEILRKHGI